MDACLECARNCVLIHQQNRKHESAVTSFFKVMFCDKYSELMFLPPKFAATVSKLANRRISLEDSHGLRWPVTISNVDGSLAFKHGWNAFFMDHGLKLGDFIFFFYLHSHFVVKIYERSGCEKLDFPKSNLSKKRTRSNREYVPIVEPSRSNDSNSMKTNSSSTSFSSRYSSEEDILPQNENPKHHSKGRCQEKPKDYIEDWFFLSDTVTRNEQNEDRRLLFDLSDFEKNGNNLCANGSKKSTVENADLYQKSDFGGDKLQLEIPVENQPEIGIFELNATEDTEQRAAPKEPDSLCSMSVSATRIEQNSVPQLPNPVATVTTKNKESDPLNLGIREPENAKKMDALASFSAPGPCKMEPHSELELYSHPGATSRGLKFVKVEPLGISPNPRGLQEIIPESYGKLQTLKTEPEDGIFDIIDIPTLPDDSMEVAGIAHDPSCLELPSKLAATGRFRNGKKVVVLKDPHKRLWPVIYFERPDLIGLMSGWKAFYGANEVQPGDECIFKLEDKSDCIYAVSIIRQPKLLQLPTPH